VALAGISTAIATIFLAVGNITAILLFTGYLVASVALSLPLAKGSYVGYIMAYVATVLLTLIVVGAGGYIIDLLPFVLFFGLHPLLNELQLKFRVHKWLALLIKTIWFDGAMLLFWWLIVVSTGVTWLDAYALPIILIGGTLFFAVYDRMFFRIRGYVFALVKRISKK
jgi:hypothetical protein